MDLIKVEKVITDSAVAGGWRWPPISANGLSCSSLPSSAGQVGSSCCGGSD